MLILSFMSAIVVTQATVAVDGLEPVLASAGSNRLELEAALEQVPTDHRPGLTWLLTHMPEEDLKTLTGEFLLENVGLAYDAWTGAPWRDEVPEEVFFDSILPYASINERRESWRTSFREQFAPLVADAKSPAEAAAILNNRIFPMVGVKYSTQRPKPDQSPMESIEAGMASCTGLSVLLVDACRSVGVPARFVGTPLWSDGSGNHSWVEIYDQGDWHFTGAAEPTGMELNKAWFEGRASGAIEGDSQRAVFAVTWRDVPLHFPLVWKPGDTSVGAVDVSRRYAVGRAPLREGQGRIRIRAVGADGHRVSAGVTMRTDDGGVLFQGMTRDERFDANDHLETVVPLGTEVEIQVGDSVERLVVNSDEQLITIETGSIGDETRRPLSLEEANSLRDRLIAEWTARERPLSQQELSSGVLTHGDLEMPLFYSVNGEPPEGGRSLYISMHGGGGAPPEVNDGQWKNQQRLYRPAEGVYAVPRAPTNTWNLWHQGHIDPLFDRLITNMVLAEGVNPDRVYLMGYSAGGDGVYQLAPRMADRFAAAAMMAGHPNETSPDGLRNLPFTIHVGEKDGGYGRNEVAARWKDLLADARASDPGGYEHLVTIHPRLGHWMNCEDVVALPWMASRTRQARPDRITWKQDDVTHERFYWLKVDRPVARDRVMVQREGQMFHVLEPGSAKALTIRLDDSMVDLDQPVVVKGPDGHTIFEGVVPRTRDVIQRSLDERGDPGGVYTAELTVNVGE